jgi:hypothetical protein
LPITEPRPPGRSPGGIARLVRRVFWTIQSLAAVGAAMVVLGLAVEEVSPGAAILRVLVLPIGILPVFGPAWAVATPVLLVAMLLTRNRRGRATDA